MTNGKSDITWHADGDAPYGGPPTNPDGIAVPFPPPGDGTFAPQLADTVSGTWLFVAVPQTDIDISDPIANFFAAIVFKKKSKRSWVHAYNDFPKSLKGKPAIVTGHPTHDYQLSKYWVAIYFVARGDSIQYASDLPVPKGLATWTQNRVQEKKSCAMSDQSD